MWAVRRIRRDGRRWALLGIVALVAAACFPPPPSHPTSTTTSSTTTSSTTTTVAPVPCSPGSFNPSTGHTPCTAALPGTFVDIAGGTSAIPCSTGSYQPLFGQSSCLLAPVGTYVDALAQIAPTACPAGTTTLTPGATSSADCRTPPVLSSFAAVTPSGSSPVTTAFGWTISDPSSLPMTCRLDLDNDGTYDMTVSACTSASLRTATFTAVGPTTVKLQVSDSGAAATATTTVTVGAASGDQFHIDFRLDASVSPDLASVFEAAAARWAAVVKTGLADTHVTLPGGCFGGPTGVDVDVDDILIDARIAPIDGAGGALAEAGPCAFRADGMPSYGVMWFDSDDAGLAATNPRLFLDTITHEMGHVLGINSSAPNWAARLDPPFGQNPVFTGPAANGIFQALGGTGTVPMVTGGGHFSDAVFNGTTQGLLMTGAASATRPDALGAVVAAALADAGYGVDLAGAEPYSLPGATPAVGGRSSGGLRYDS